MDEAAPEDAGPSLLTCGTRPAVTQFASFLYSFGGDWYSQRTRKATLNTPQAIAAFKFYGDRLRKDGPPGVLNMSPF